MGKPIGPADKDNRRHVVKFSPAPSVGDSLRQGGRPMRGPVPGTIAGSLKQGDKNALNSIAPGKVTTIRGSFKQ